MSNCNNWHIANTAFKASYRHDIQNSTIVNSVFVGTVNQPDGLNLDSCFIDLCIITDWNENSNTYKNTNFSRCLSNISLPGNSNLKLPIVNDPNAVLFVGGTGTSIVEDNDFALTNWEGFSDPVFGGRQPGIFGGSSPYRLSGLPNVPVIMRATGESTVVQGNNLVLEVEVELAE